MCFSACPCICTFMCTHTCLRATEASVHYLGKSDKHKFINTLLYQPKSLHPKASIYKWKFSKGRHLSASTCIPVLFTTLLTNGAFIKIWKTHKFVHVLLLCFGSSLSAPGDISVCFMCITHVFSFQLQAPPPRDLLIVYNR